MGSFFVNSAIGWATLALVSIPIIIHLINRRRFRRIDWAAMEFLLQALRRNRRRVRIEQLILLLLRIALMLLLGLAIARPVLSDAGLQWFAGAFRSEEKVFVLDDSRSTTLRYAGRTVFERGVEALTNALDRLAIEGGADRVSVLQGSRYRAPLVRRSFIDEETSARLSRRLSTLSGTDGRLPLAESLDAILDSTAGRTEGPPRPLAVSILTDLRREDWTDAGGGPRAPLESALRALRQNEETPARVVVVDVGNEETANVAVTGVTLAGGVAVRQIPTEFFVEIENFGSSPVHGLEIGLRYAPAERALSGRPGWIDVIGPPVEPLDAGETKSYRIPCTFQNAGPHAIRVELRGSGDALEADNAYPVAVEVVESHFVLIVNGEPASERFEGETDFLEAALAPSGDLGSGILPEVVVEDNLPRDSLEKYSAVFVCNLFSIPEEFQRLLEKYVERGGALIVFPGDQTDAGLYNRRLGPSERAETDAETSDAGSTPARGGDASPAGDASTPGAGAARKRPRSSGLLPARLAGLRTPRDPPALSPDFDHTYFRSLRDVQEALEFVRFRSYYALEPAPEAQVIARFLDTDRSPAIVEHAFGNGRVILFASSADLEWSDWPRSPTYLVLIQDLLASVIRTRSLRARHLAGDPLDIPVDIARYELEARVRGPGYPEVAERVLIASPGPSESDRPGRRDTGPANPAVANSGDSAGAEDRGEAESSSEPSGGGNFRFVVEDTHIAGHYGVALKTKAGEEEWRLYAVHGDPAESNLRRVSAEELAELYPDAGLTVVEGTTGFHDVGRGRFEIADALLWMFLAFLFVEGFLAWKFAHHRLRNDE